MTVRVYDVATRASLVSRRDLRLRHLEPRDLEVLARGGLLMANNPLPYDASVIAAVNAFTALLNSGFIKVYSGAQPALNGAVTGTLLATMTFGATAFPTSTATGGLVTATANAITSGSAGNTGTAGYFALVKSDNVTVAATGSVGTSGADLNLNTLSIVSGNTVSCASFLVTMPET
jgi:hypothetical protein